MSAFPSTLLVNVKDKLKDLVDKKESAADYIQTEIRKANLDLLDKINKLSDEITVLQTFQVSCEYASNSDSANADDTTSFVNGSGGAAGIIGVSALTAFRAKRIQFSKAILSTDFICIELYDPVAGSWVNGDIKKSTYPICNHFVQNDDTGGMSLTQVSPTQMDVVFGTYPAGISSVNWLNASYAGIKWRVRKLSIG
jgi:hypothetical protein